MKKAQAKEDTVANVTSLSVEALEVWGGNTRLGTTEGLEELTESIKTQGILQPLLVRRTKNETRAAYEVICGKRRLTAAKAAGIELIPCYIRQLTDSQATAAVATENIQREDFTPWDAYLAVDHAIGCHATVETAALALGKPVSWTRRVASLGDLAGIWCQTSKDNPAISLAFLERVARLPEAIQQNVWDNHGGEFEDGGDMDIVDREESRAFSSIEDCPWIKSRELCEGCKYRTDVQNELFPDFAKDAQCTNADCRELRRLEYIEEQKAKAAKLAKTTVAQVQTTDYKRFNDSTAKTKSNTIPVIVSNGLDTGKIVWRKPDTPGGETSDATPKGPTPAQRMAAKYIRDIDKQVRDGLLGKWVDSASDEAKISAILLFGCPPTCGQADIKMQYEEIFEQTTPKTEALIAEGIQDGVLSCLRFETVSTCDQAYANAKDVAEIFDAKQPSAS